MWRTPVRAILLQTAWAAVLVLAWGTFESLVTYVLFVDSDLLRPHGGGGLRGGMRRRRRRGPGGYVVPGFPWVPGAFVAVSVWFVGSTLHEGAHPGGRRWSLLALGVPPCGVWRRRGAS